MKDKINQFREDHGDRVRTATTAFCVGFGMGAFWAIIRTVPVGAHVVTTELGEKMIAVTDRSKITTLLELNEK